MKLTDKERDIFSVAQLAPRLSVNELRSYCGYRDHTIRYHLQRGLEDGLLIPRCFVNLNLLGYMQFEVYFSLSANNPQARQLLLKALCESERVSWMGEVGGDFQYGANICARSLAEVTQFFDSLSTTFGHLVLDREIAVRVSLDYFGNKYLSEKNRPRSSLSYAVTENRVDIDELDHRILRELMKNSPLIRRVLAQNLGLPLSTLEHRLKKLEQSGVIVGYYYLIDPARIGMQSFLFLVGVKGMNAKLRGELSAFAAGHPNVVVFINTIGSWDIELAVEVETARQSVEISEALQTRFGPAIRFMKVLPSFGYPKVLEYPFEEFKVANG
ncbi:MAG: winged helix-turn-helix transcriptional regulator [Bdellovibrionota bacterium]